MGLGETLSWGPTGEKIFDFFFIQKWLILLYFIFLSDGGAPKRCKAQGNLSSYPPPLFRWACVCCVVDRGPLMALVLEKEDAVDAWRELLGPAELDVALIESPDRSVQS